jgi:hypothetical protein
VLGKISSDGSLNVRLVSLKEAELEHELERFFADFTSHLHTYFSMRVVF